MKKLLILMMLMASISCEKQPLGSDCIDLDKVNPDAICYALYDPVCGCDGQTYENDCVANAHGVLSYSQGACKCEYPYSGVVVDYSGLDGCSLMILLSDSTLLEPVHLPQGATLVEGMSVDLHYREVTTHASACMAGKLADIFCLKVSSCIPIKPADLTAVAFPDPVYIKTASIHGDCLTIDYEYQGGCNPHTIELRELAFFCGTPPLPPMVLELNHDAQNDECKALISEQKSFDLKGIQQSGQSSVDFYLNDPSRNYNQKFTYHY